MKSFLPCLFILSCFIACHKDIGSEAAAAGSISGTITPAGAVLTVTATSNKDSAKYSAKPDSSGAFTITGLPAGSYTVSFTAAAASTQIANRDVTVKAKENTDMGVIDIAAGTGGIIGVIDPPGTVLSIILINTNSQDSVKYTTAPGTGGSFMMGGIPPGDYTVHFNTAPIAAPIADYTITIRANDFVGFGTVKVTLVMGSLGGRAIPSTALSSVTATSGTNKYTVTPGNDGGFLIDSLLPGTYMVSFTVAPGFGPVKDTIITLADAENASLGTIMPKLFTAGSKIDTITGEHLTEAELLEREPYDSIIVINGNLSISGTNPADAIKEALNKITSVTGYLLIMGDNTVQSITMNKVTQMGAFLISGMANLTSISLPKLTSLSGLQIWNTEKLTGFKLGALQQLSGMVSIISTGLSSLEMLGTAVYKPFTLELEYNQNLTHIGALKFGSDSVYNLTITGNTLLSSLDGLQGIRKAKNQITISGNAGLTTLKGLNNIDTAKLLQIDNNPQLTELCPAKTVINALKDLPVYTQWRLNTSGEWVQVTIDPFIASGDGSYITEADVIAAVAQCP